MDNTIQQRTIKQTEYTITHSPGGIRNAERSKHMWAKIFFFQNFDKIFYDLSGVSDAEFSLDWEADGKVLQNQFTAKYPTAKAFGHMYTQAKTREGPNENYTFYIANRW